MAEKGNGNVRGWLTFSIAAAMMLGTLVSSHVLKADKADVDRKADKTEVVAVRDKVNTNCTSIARIDAEVKSNKEANQRLLDEIKDVRADTKKLLELMLEEKGKK